jgi:hypothetical protein
MRPQPASIYHGLIGNWGGGETPTEPTISVLLNRCMSIGALPYKDRKKFLLGLHRTCPRQQRWDSFNTKATIEVVAANDVTATSTEGRNTLRRVR